MTTFSKSYKACLDTCVGRLGWRMLSLLCLITSRLEGCNVVMSSFTCLYLFAFVSVCMSISQRHYAVYRRFVMSKGLWRYDGSKRS